MLDLSEKGLYIIGMYDNVVIGISDEEVICLDENVITHGAKLAVEF